MKKLIVILCLSLAFSSTTGWTKCPVEGLNSMDDIRKMIAENDLQDVPNFVACLPLEYRQQYVLVHDSKSPEKGDVDEMHPRVISFGADAKKIV